MKILKKYIPLVLVSFAGLVNVTSIHKSEFSSDVYLSDSGEFKTGYPQIFLGDTEIPETNPPLSFDDFLNDIGFKESSNRYDAVNSYGYIGKYQFSSHLLWRLGFEVTREEFLNSPQLQETAMLVLLRHNKEVLEPVIQEFEGKTFNELTVTDKRCYVSEFKITESGILAAAHLIGPYRTRLFLERKILTKDGYGTYVSQYLYDFSGYNINI